MENRRLIYSIILLIISINVYCQTDYNLNKNYLIDHYIKNLNQTYNSTINKKNNYISGKLNREYSFSKYNHPYYLDNEWSKGVLFYDTLQYPVEAIKYDIYQDRILYLNKIYNNAFPITINNFIVKKFIINTSKFIYKSDFGKKSNNIFKPGYYEVLHQGNVSLYMRWEKYKKIDNSARSFEYKNNAYFALYKDGKYRKFKNEFKLKILLRDQKNEIKTYLKKNKLYNADFKVNAQNLVKFYDSLTDN